MIKQLLLAGAVLLTAASASATIPAPGFKKSEVKEQRGLQAAKPQEFKLDKAIKPGALTLTSALKHYAMTAASEERVDVERLTSWTDQNFINDEGEMLYTITRTFDDYGFPAKDVAANTSTVTNIIEYEYTWEVPGKIWNSKKIYYVDGTERELFTTETRTFHDNGSVKRIEIAIPSGTYIEFTEYDANGLLIGNGWKQILDNGFVNREEKLYVPFVGRWGRLYENQDEKNEVEINDEELSVTEKTYQNLTGTPDGYVLVQEQILYFDDQKQFCGQVEINYDPEGNVTSKYGERRITTEANGVITYDNLNLEQTGENEWQWKSSSKEEISAALYDLKYEAGAKYFIKSYYDNKLASETIYEWVAQQILKETETYYYSDGESTEISYRYVYPGKNNIRDTRQCYYSESTGDYALRDWDGVYEYYRYYNSNDQLVKSLRESDEIDRVPVWEVSTDGNTWGKCTGEVVIYSTDSEKLIATFDEQGRLTKTYELESDGDIEQEEYFYTADGYKSISSETDRDQEDYPTLHKDSYEVFTLAADGESYTKIYGNYKDGVELPYSRTDFYAKESAVHYYSYNDGTWKLNFVSYEPQVTDLGNGYIETIQYADRDGVKTPSFKSVVKKTETLTDETSYRWDEENNEWQGEYRQLRGIQEPAPVAVVYPQDPTQNSDEYFVPTYDDASDASIEVNWEASYSWNYDTKEFMLNFNTHKEYQLEGNKVTIKQYEGITPVTQVVEFDSEKRVLSDSKNNAEGNETQKYAYDEKGRLTENATSHTHGDSGETFKNVRKYTYSAVSILGVEDQIGDDLNAPVEYFNLQGIRVAKPENGIYLRRQGNKVSKIVR